MIPTIRPVLFIDVGGVLNDNRKRRVEWERMVGDFMPPRLGGTPEVWRKANVGVFQEVWGEVQAQIADYKSYRDFYRTYASGWVSRMCSRVGVPEPSEERAIEIYQQLAVHIAERASCAYPGLSKA